MGFFDTIYTPTKPLKTEKIMEKTEVNTERFFIDERVGCIAVRDRLHPSYDPDYPGLHFDTKDVIFYAHGNNSSGEWRLSEREIEKAKEVLEHLKQMQIAPL